MGYDVSYHPISEEQMHRWYFEVLKNQDLISKVSEEQSLDAFFVERYEEIITEAQGAESSRSFDNTHGLSIAIIQGLFEQYFYIRGGALSFCEFEGLDKYLKEWAEIVDLNAFQQVPYGRFMGNYNSGIYVSKEGVVDLLADYEKGGDIKKEMDELFSHGRIDIFLKALEYAKNKGLGLLEATEVFSPQPFDLDETVCYSDIENCCLDGVFLYVEAAQEQMAEVMAADESKEDESEPKKGFWGRLFGKN